MSNNMIYRSMTVVAVALSTAACAPRFVEFSEVNADRVGYLHKNFSQQDIAPEVSAKLPKTGSAQSDFKSITVRFLSVYAETGKTENRLVTQRFENAGNGLIHEQSEYSQNDIPYRLFFSLSYAGVLPLKTQIADHRAKYANFAIVTTEIDSISGDPLSLKENDVFDVKWKTRYDRPNSQELKQSFHCKAGQTFAATKLSPNLKGEAQYLDCDRFSNDILNLKMKYALLKKYGVAITLGNKASNYSVTDTINEITVD